MNILILENESYLAQSISSNLFKEDNNHFEIVSSVSDLKHLKDDFDVVLLSTNLSGNIYNVIDRFKNSVIILLISYISHDTVTMPIEVGASDYIIKPFMMEELQRKILKELSFKELEFKNSSMKEQLKYLLDEIEINDVKFDLSDVLFVNSKSHITLHKFVCDIAKKYDCEVMFYNLEDGINNILFKKDVVFFFTNFDLLGERDKKSLLKKAKKYKVVIESYRDESLEISSKNNPIFIDDILSIEEYIKFTIKTYQDKYPDTELSKRLGMSRKSLWEKRKKYELLKKR